MVYTVTTTTFLAGVCFHFFDSLVFFNLWRSRRLRPPYSKGLRCSSRYPNKRSDMPLCPSQNNRRIQDAMNASNVPIQEGACSGWYQLPFLVFCRLFLCIRPEIAVRLSRSLQRVPDSSWSGWVSLDRKNSLLM